MTGRATTRGHHPTQARSAPLAVEQVQDPAVRAILLARRRALLMEAAEIARRCGLDDEEGAGAVPAARTA